MESENTTGSNLFELSRSRVSIPDRKLGKLEDYVSASSLHGFQYLSRLNLWVERLFWLLTILAGFCLAFALIFNSYRSEQSLRMIRVCV